MCVLLITLKSVGRKLMSFLVIFWRLPLKRIMTVLEFMIIIFKFELLLVKWMVLREMAFCIKSGLMLRIWMTIRLSFGIMLSCRFINFSWMRLLLNLKRVSWMVYKGIWRRRMLDFQQKGFSINCCFKVLAFIRKMSLLF